MLGDDSILLVESFDLVGLFDELMQACRVSTEAKGLKLVGHLDTNLSRTFELRSHGLAADRHQSITLNARSANLLNHTNATTVGSVVGSPTFTAPLAAEAARRVEFGIRYTF